MTVKELITLHLETHQGWISGMELESKAYEWHTKRIGRTLREMSSGIDSILEKDYSEGRHAVKYRIKQQLDWAESYLDKLRAEEQVNQGTLL